MVYPDTETDESDTHFGQHNVGVADHSLAGECGDDRGNQPERGKDDEIDLRVAEDPEQVLPEDWVTASGHVKEVESESSLKEEKQVGNGEEGGQR